MISLRIEVLETYKPAYATALGRLMTFLSEKADGQPISADLLKDIIASKHHRQYAAWIGETMVGAATLSIILGPRAGRYAYLNDLVVDPAYPDYHIGTRLYAEIEAWCRAEHMRMDFTSRPDRQAAHRFYLNKGAVIRDTTVFRAFDEL